MQLWGKDESLQLLGSRKPMATRAPGPTWAKNFLHFGCYHQQKLAGAETKKRDWIRTANMDKCDYIPAPGIAHLFRARQFCLCDLQCHCHSEAHHGELPVQSLPPHEPAPYSILANWYYPYHWNFARGSLFSTQPRSSSVFYRPETSWRLPHTDTEMSSTVQRWVSSCHHGSCPDSSPVRCFWDLNSCLGKTYGCGYNWVGGTNIAGSML